MQAGLGPAFHAARQGEAYAARTGQWWPWVLLILVLQLVVLSILQGVFGLVAKALLFGGLGDLTSTSPEDAKTFAKAMIVGLMPASVLAALFAWWSAGWANPTGERGIPLALPALGLGGWMAICCGMIVVMWGTMMLTFLVLGIDPASYAPVDGPDSVSASGLVEKTMAELAGNPLLFALAVPGVVLAVPLAEEFIFRGALFALLRNSWFGKTGAVVITAALWALFHGAAAPWLFVFVIFVMGLVLGVLLLRFGSLWVTVAAHAAWNAFSSTAIFGIVSST